MENKELLVKDSCWMQNIQDTPIVLSTRVRLARNLAGASFPHILGAEGGKEVEKKISDTFGETVVSGEQFTYLSLGVLNPLERRILVEKHLISPDLANGKEFSGVALTDSHKVSVMVNEEDHLRIQVLMPGFNLSESLALAKETDEKMESKLDFAFKEKFGYLTACPTNVGTGLRISVMIHLPALVMTNQVQQVLGALTHIGLAVRGLYGEGSRALGNVFQISNQVTLGKSEEDTLAYLETMTGQIAERESQARQDLWKEVGVMLQDKVWRARGTLEHARLLSGDEVIGLLSEDRMGVEMGILPKVQAGFASLLVNSSYGCLQYRIDRPLDGNYADFERANYIRGVYHTKD
ncbi:ATP:guanido phosphotransferase [Syntrophobotulus glycolicus DSM 8271]|uniref:Protein-arginine kinase n=1 Tax=Syntrophobotulus glycolicus (strain DSM 8271 / FlGlyR) TaxID=645991 RepID=F0SWX2_SYNGF|nr:protein arginine kinase [Syntrophobotulus glycolicus]ADY54662.1 ATP:guanido phosphotransferase [Syntrophobotulus glycolicus DSM 8271]